MVHVLITPSLPRHPHTPAQVCESVWVGEGQSREKERDCDSGLSPRVWHSLGNCQLLRKLGGREEGREAVRSNLG